VFLAYVGMKEEARLGSRSIKYLELNPAQIRQDPVRCTQGPCDYPRALLYRSAVPSGTCSASRPKQAKSSQKYQLSDLDVWQGAKPLAFTRLSSMIMSNYY
jgi:hypothetical protein